MNLSKLFATGILVAGDDNDDDVRMARIYGDLSADVLLPTMTEIISSVEEWVESDGIPGDSADQLVTNYILSSTQRPTGLQALAISLRSQLAAAKARNQVCPSRIRSVRRRYLGPTP